MFTVGALLIKIQLNKQMEDLTHHFLKTTIIGGIQIVYCV